MQIDIKNLACGYHGKPLLQDINFSIGSRQMWCVLGANGIGKTTFFKTVLGLLRPVSGSLSLDGTPLHQWSRKELAKRIAYVPQSHTPPFPFLVEEVVAMGRNPYQKGAGKMSVQDRDAVAEAMDTLDIAYLEGKAYTQISGGERQLTLLARAIAQQTPVLVLDEPVSNLDFGNQARVISHICNLVEKLGRTIIMTTHVPDHSFLPDANVFMLYRDGHHQVGQGRQIVTEAAVQQLYSIDNRIVQIESCQKTVCLPIYGGSPRKTASL